MIRVMVVLINEVKMVCLLVLVCFMFSSVCCASAYVSDNSGSLSALCLQKCRMFEQALDDLYDNNRDLGNTKKKIQEILSDCGNSNLTVGDDIDQYELIQHTLELLEKIERYQINRDEKIREDAVEFARKIGTSDALMLAGKFLKSDDQLHVDSSK